MVRSTGELTPAWRRADIPRARPRRVDGRQQRLTAKRVQATDPSDHQATGAIGRAACQH